MKLLIVLFATCAVGYVADHWQQIKEQHTLFPVAEAPGLIIYRSKTCAACAHLEAQLTRAGITFQKRNLDDETNSRELTDKLARLGRAGGRVAMPVADVDGVLIVGASFEQIRMHIH